MPEEIVPADKRLRVVFLALIAAGALLVVANSTLSRLAGSYDPAEDPEQIYQELVVRIRLIASIGAVPLLVFAAYFGSNGWRTLRCGAWPPYGMRVPWSLARRRGRYAVAMGVGNIALAALFVFQAAVSIWSAWFVVE
ncbi:MAG: hypothetical protein IH957_12150 [Chloroflexi bacterium]|nr:hypothetical protein [Chloroflexota bacterium]